MSDHLQQAIRQILSHHRHLMTESERRADRAFVYQSQLDAADHGRPTGDAQDAMDEALEDAAAEMLFQKGRERFLIDMAQRIMAEHGPTLPRCGACGQVFKTPNPRDCFDCDMHGSRTMNS